jgi:hypothetical protein
MREIDPTTISARLAAAIDQIYDAFRAPIPPVIEGCPCCIKSRGVDVLLTTPLRRLNGMQLWRYTTGCFLTVGSTRDFQYFLPRIIELAIQEADVPDTEIILGKLPLAAWRQWPSHLYNAVDQAILVWFEHALIKDVQHYECLFSTESLLCGAALAGKRLAPMLEMLSQPFAKPLLVALKAAYPEPKASWWYEPEAAEGYGELLAFLSRS